MSNISNIIATLPYKNPQKLKKDILNIVVGQDEAVDKVVNYLFKHIISICAQENGLHTHNKSNLLLTGNSGCGKTFVIQVACGLMNLPFIEINCKSISQEGWSGTSLIKHLQEGLYNIPKSLYKFSIIFLDEFDKLCMPNYSSGGDDVSIHLQNGLLKTLEGSILSGHGLNTAELCFILAGNFHSMRQNRISKGIGFSGNLVNKSNHDIYEELIKFGVIPELAGRISDVIELNDLDEHTLLEILNNDNFIYKNWQNIFNECNIDFSISGTDKDKIIEEAKSKKTGARGLYSLVHNKIDETMLKNPEKIETFVRRFGA